MSRLSLAMIVLDELRHYAPEVPLTDWNDKSAASSRDGPIRRREWFSSCSPACWTGARS
jgi:hypothetical protein